MKNINPSQYQSNVFLILDMLEDYTQLHNIGGAGINCINISYDELSACLEKTDSSVLRQENTIILASWDFITEEIVKKIKESFEKKYAINSLKIIFFVQNLNQIANKNFEVKEKYSYYVLPSGNCDHDKYADNLIFFIKSQFNQLVAKEVIDGFIVDSFKVIADAEIINKQKIEIEILNKKLEKISMVDHLTNVLNRRAFFEAIHSEMKRTKRLLWRASKDDCFKELNIAFPEKNNDQLMRQNPTGHFFDHCGRFACIMVDLDHFKNINDKKGHIVGDQVLHEIGTVLRSKDLFRESDIIGRYGGEEFIVMLPDTNSAGAQIVAERLRNLISATVFTDGAADTFSITASIGVAEYRMTDDVPEKIINRADQALYYAKNYGRNQVVLYDDVFSE